MCVKLFLLENRNAHVLATIPGCFWNTVVQLKFHWIFFLSFSVRFLYLRDHLNCFITLIVTCLQNYAMTAVISLRSRHFRRARENFFANVLFLTVFCKIDNASSTELRYINFLQFRKSNGCSHDG